MHFLESGDGYLKKIPLARISLNMLNQCFSVRLLQKRFWTNYYLLYRPKTSKLKKLNMLQTNKYHFT